MAAERRARKTDSAPCALYDAGRGIVQRDGPMGAEGGGWQASVSGARAAEIRRRIPPQKDWKSARGMV
jgi:hypothetical protein